MLTFIQSLVSHLGRILLIASLLDLTMAVSHRDPLPQKDTSFHFRLKQQNILQVKIHKATSV